MHPAPFGFMPAYHYENGMGLTLYHHDHYVHYTTMDLVLRAVLSIVFFIVLAYLICYLVGLCKIANNEEY